MPQKVTDLVQSITKSLTGLSPRVPVSHAGLFAFFCATSQAVERKRVLERSGLHMPRRCQLSPCFLHVFFLPGFPVATFCFVFVCFPPPFPAPTEDELCCVQSLSHVLLFETPADCILPGSSVHGIFQARILEWVRFLPLGHLPCPGIEPASPALAGRFFTTHPTGKLTEEDTQTQRNEVLAKNEGLSPPLSSQHFTEQMV